MPTRAWRLLYLCAVAAVFLALFFGRDALRFPLQWDETHFWATSLEFSREPIPSLDLLRNYGELNTPLPFFLYGHLERLTGEGLFLGRLLNVLLALFITLVVGFSRRGKPALLATVGLLLFPYFLYYSTLLYTDTLAAALVLLGVVLHRRGRPVPAAVLFALAIAARQYMLAFPLALVAHEVAQRLCGRPRPPVAWAAPLFAAATILFWLALFGGAAPAAGIAERPVADVQREWWAIGPAASLYFLACLGMYFVVPEAVLFRRWRSLNGFRDLLTPRNGALALGLALALVAFPPPVAHGILTKALRLLSADVLQVPFFYGLALFSALRFGQRLDLAFWLVLMNAGIMLKAFPWDKYLFPLLVVLWYLKGTGYLDAGADEALGEAAVPDVGASGGLAASPAAR